MQQKDDGLDKYKQALKEYWKTYNTPSGNNNIFSKMLKKKMSGGNYSEIKTEMVRTMDKIASHNPTGPSISSKEIPFQSILDSIDGLHGAQLAVLIEAIIKNIDGKEFEHTQGHLLMHIILHQMNVYDADKRHSLVQRLSTLFDSRIGQFRKEKKDIIDKMRELVLEYDNLLRAESIMNTLEKETQKDGE